MLRRSSLGLRVRGTLSVRGSWEREGRVVRGAGRRLPSCIMPPWLPLTPMGPKLGLGPSMLMLRGVRGEEEGEQLLPVDWRGLESAGVCAGAMDDWVLAVSGRLSRVESEGRLEDSMGAGIMTVGWTPRWS